MKYSRLKAEGYFEDVGFDGAISERFRSVYSLMMEGMPLREGFLCWSDAKGIRNAAVGKHPAADMNVTVPIVMDWVKGGAVDPIPCRVYDEAVLQYDFLNFPIYQLIVSERVKCLFELECPHDFEAFRLEFDGVDASDFYLINATKRGSVEDLKEGRVGGDLVRLQETAVFGVTTAEIVVSDRMVEKFGRFGFTGFRLVPLGETKR